MKIRPLEAELFHAEKQTNEQTDGRTDGRTDGGTNSWHDEANSRNLKF